MSAGASGDPREVTGSRASHLSAASDLVAADKLADAEREILIALGMAPKDVQALNLLALVRYKLGRLAEAQATYREIAGAAPGDASARRNLGLVALKLGRLEEALPELEMAVRLAPGDERAWSYLGYAYAKKGEVVEAAAAFRRAKQDALASELEHAATVRRPPTPSFHFGHVAALQRTGTGEWAREPASPPAPPAPSAPPPVRAAEAAESHGPVALAPPLPPLSSAEPAPREIREPLAETVEPPGKPVEASPVSLLGFVLSRLGQSPAPAAPVGPLRLTIADEVHVRADAVLAGAGALEWQLASRRAQGRRGTEPLGEGAGRFFRLTGSGDVWIAGAAERWLPVALTDDVLYVREDRVLAFDGQVSWEAGTVPGAGLRMLQFRGRGTVALDLDRAPLAIKVTEERPALLSGARLVGWVGRLVPYGARLEEGAPFQLACQGEGVVLLDAGGR
jgi:uncharacterized protein (AIM24 family)